MNQLAVSGVIYIYHSNVPAKRCPPSRTKKLNIITFGEKVDKTAPAKIIIFAWTAHNDNI